MDKSKEITAFNHALQLTDRKNLIISGIKKIENFDEKHFFLESNMGYILIKGACLELIKLDTFQGSVSIKGEVDSIQYLDESKSTNKESFFKLLFK